MNFDKIKTGKGVDYMKKIIMLLLGLSVILFSSCGVDDYEEKKPKKERTVDISSGIKENGYEFNYSFDLDFDGKDEEIKMEVLFDEPELFVSIGDYNGSFEIFDGNIEKVYVTDIDEDDNKKDLVIYTCEVSGDPRIRILKFDENLTPYKFNSEYHDSLDFVLEDSRWTGYIDDYYFKVNDDDSITLKEQTDSLGMWTVYKSFALVDDAFEETVPEKYEILPENITVLVEYMEDIDEKEREMLKKGYLRAYATIELEDITINEGEYFKPVYDNGKDDIYIEKENGEEGWIYIGTEAVERRELHKYFFMLAG